VVSGQEVNAYARCFCKYSLRPTSTHLCIVVCCRSDHVYLLSRSWGFRQHNWLLCTVLLPTCWAVGCLSPHIQSHLFSLFPFSEGLKSSRDSIFVYLLIPLLGSPFKIVLTPLPSSFICFFLSRSNPSVIFSAHLQLSPMPLLLWSPGRVPDSSQGLPWSTGKDFQPSCAACVFAEPRSLASALPLPRPLCLLHFIHPESFDNEIVQRPHPCSIPAQTKGSHCPHCTKSQSLTHC
jgi:hypothetical protein